MRSFIRSCSLVVIALVSLLTFSAIVAEAQTGVLERGFSASLTNNSSSQDYGRAVAIQPDGKIVVAGYSQLTTYDFALVRFNPNGSLDTTFNGTGKVRTDFGGQDKAFAIVLQPDGKIVVAGYSAINTNDFALARYNPDGSLDTSFNNGGLVLTPIGSSQDFAFSVALQQDGKIVAAGYSFNGSNYDFALVRYNTDGTLDSSFNGTGKVITDVGGNDYGQSVAIQPDGRIVVAGYTDGGTNLDFALTRYNANGTLDTSFNGTGKVVTSVGSGNDAAYAVAIQTDAKIVVAGYSTGATDDFAVARYNTDGTLDASFGGTGKVTTPIGNSTDQAYAIAIQPNGRIVVAGTSVGADNDFALARYNIDGSLDGTFGIGGKVAQRSSGVDSQAYSIALQPNGKVVVAGHTQTPNSNPLFLVLRYSGDTNAVPGNIDLGLGGIGGIGRIVTPIGSGADVSYAVAVQRDGKIVVAGESSNGSNRDFSLARYNPGGTLDPTFNGTGKVITPVGSGDDGAREMIIQPDGKIVVGGYASNGSNNDFALARYNPDGSLDTSFNGTGTVTTSVTSGSDQVNGVALQSDGKIVAVGSAGGKPAVVRYNPNGSLDTSFNGTGIVFDNNSNDTSASAVAIQPDGKIVVAVIAFGFTVLRYNPDGTPDTTFNGSGRAATIYSILDTTRDVVLQPDGKIVLAGGSFGDGSGCCEGNTPGHFVLVRFNANGTLDTTFGGTGKVATMPDPNTDNFAYALVIQPDGKLIAAGYSNGSVTADLAMVRYNPNGTLDPSFGEGGIFILHPGLGGIAQDMALQPNGRIVVVGASTSAVADFSLARILGDLHIGSDFDGDYRADISVWNPNNHNWYIRQSKTNLDRTQIDWGNGALGDISVPRDYDGDGKTDIAIWRPSEGNWYIIQSSNNAIRTQGWGLSTDIPVPADYDGDGKADLAVYRPSEGNWYIINSSNNGGTSRGWGLSTDKPVPADYDGDGKADLAVYRPSEGNWYIINSSTNTVTLRQWGNSTDQLVPADYDGDGRTDIAVFRPSEGTWYIIQSSTGTVRTSGLGTSGDIVVPADYDQDGKADIAIFRPSEGNWYIMRSSTNSVLVVNFGSFGDVPAPSTYVPQ